MDKKPPLSPQEEQDPQIHVKDITYDVKRRDVLDKFKQFGRVGQIMFRGTSCVVQFYNYKHAKEALKKCNGKDIFGIGKKNKV